MIYEGHLYTRNGKTYQVLTIENCSPIVGDVPGVYYASVVDDVVDRRTVQFATRDEFMSLFLNKYVKDKETGEVFKATIEHGGATLRSLYKLRTPVYLSLDNPLSNFTPIEFIDLVKPYSYWTDNWGNVRCLTRFNIGTDAYYLTDRTNSLSEQFTLEHLESEFTPTQYHGVPIRPGYTYYCGGALAVVTSVGTRVDYVFTGHKDIFTKPLVEFVENMVVGKAWK